MFQCFLILQYLYSCNRGTDGLVVGHGFWIVVRFFVWKSTWPHHSTDQKSVGSFHGYQCQLCHHCSGLAFTSNVFNIVLGACTDQNVDTCVNTYTWKYTDIHVSFYIRLVFSICIYGKINFVFFISFLGWVQKRSKAKVVVGRRNNSSSRQSKIEEKRWRRSIICTTMFLITVITIPIITREIRIHDLPPTAKLITRRIQKKQSTKRTKKSGRKVNNSKSNSQNNICAAFIPPKNMHKINMK